MSSPIQGAGASGREFQSILSKTEKTTVRAFNHNVSQTEGKIHIVRGHCAAPDTPLSLRMIRSPADENNDLLTSQGLKNIAGDPKASLFKKSPNYTALLDALDQYQKLAKEGATTGKKLEALGNVEEKLASYQDRKESRAKHVSGDKLAEVMTRISGTEKVKIAVQNEKNRLQLESIHPSSIKDITNNLHLYQNSGALGAEYLAAHLSSCPPQNAKELLEVASLYTNEGTLEEHFDRLQDTGKARSIMISAPEGSALKKIAAQKWAPDKIKRSVPTLPGNREALIEKEKQLEKELSRQKVPETGIKAALDALRSQTIASWENNTEPVYQNIPVKKAIVSPPPSTILQRLEKQSGILFNELRKIPSGFRQPASTGQENSVKQQYSSLPAPVFNERNNLLHSPEFKTQAKIRFGGSPRERDILPCPQKSAVQADGKFVYHANHVRMPQAHYIAAQGPDNSQENQNQYWKMLSSQEAQVSIDLTNTQDPDSKKRTIQYMPPPGKTRQYGDISVTNHGEKTVMNGRFTLQQLEVNGKPHTRIQHNQFNDRTPGSPADLVALSLLAKSANKNAADVPIVIHCSAGIGRTGTLISIMDQVDHAQKGLSRDPAKSIETFREARGPKGVQTAGQLHTILQTHRHADEIIAPLLKVMQ